MERKDEEQKTKMRLLKLKNEKIACMTVILIQIKDIVFLTQVVVCYKMLWWG